jgi:hypothetical protein
MEKTTPASPQAEIAKTLQFILETLKPCSRADLFFVRVPSLRHWSVWVPTPQSAAISTRVA